MKEKEGAFVQEAFENYWNRQWEEKVELLNYSRLSMANYIQAGV
jgi:hypothetical protein